MSRVVCHQTSKLEMNIDRSQISRSCSSNAPIVIYIKCTQKLKKKHFYPTESIAFRNLKRKNNVALKTQKYNVTEKGIEISSIIAINN
jgi:hypothetical protein